MKYSTGIEYLICRDGRYSVRVQVPKDIQHKLGRTEFKKAMGADFAVAKRNSHSVIADFQRQIEAARKASNDDFKYSTSQTNDIGIGEINSAVRAHYKKMGLHMPAPFVLDRKTKIERLEDVMELQLSINADQAWSSASQDARWICEEHGWKLDENGPHFEYLCEAMLRARIQAYRDEIRRLKGNRALDAEADPLFSRDADEPSKFMVLGDLIDQLKAEGELRWSVSTKVNYRIVFRVLEEICGRETPVASIDRKFCLVVRDALLRLPSNYQKKVQTKGKSISDAIEIGERLGLPKMMPGTINSHLARLRAIVHAGRDAGLIVGNPMVDIEVQDDIRPEEKRDPFSVEQLNQIFATLPWSNGPTSAISEPAKYWGPLIALFSGARLSEIYGQLVDEIIERDGQMLFDFKHRPATRPMKHNKSRVVPVHPTLVELGFSEFVKAARMSGRELLFSDVKRDARGKWGDAQSDWLSRKIAKLKLKGANLSFHSFRHTFEDALREVDLHDTPLGNQIMGRWSAGTSKYYGKGFSTAKLCDAVASISYPGLDLTRLKLPR